MFQVFGQIKRPKPCFGGGHKCQLPRWIFLLQKQQYQLTMYLCRNKQLKKMSSTKSSKTRATNIAIQENTATYAKLNPLYCFSRNFICNYGHLESLDRLSLQFHKGNSKLNMTNYRPISILLTFNKILEKLMYKRLQNFLEKK